METAISQRTLGYLYVESQIATVLGSDLGTPHPENILKDLVKRGGLAAFVVKIRPGRTGRSVRALFPWLSISMDSIVLSAHRGIDQCLVSRVYFAETFRRMRITRIPVRMPFHGPISEGAPDLFLAGTNRYPQELIIASLLFWLNNAFQNASSQRF
jgi:hypothetical protein